MKCVITKEQQGKLRTSVAKRLLNNIEAGSELTSEAIMKDIYNLIFNKTKDHITALSYARFVPKFITQISSVEDTIAKALLEANVDLNKLTAQHLEFFSEKPQDSIEKAIGVNTENATHKTLKVLNKKNHDTQLKLDLNGNPQPQFTLGQEVLILRGNNKGQTSKITVLKQGGKVELENGSTLAYSSIEAIVNDDALDVKYGKNVAPENVKTLEERSEHLQNKLDLQNQREENSSEETIEEVVLNNWQSIQTASAKKETGLRVSAKNGDIHTSMVSNKGITVGVLADKIASEYNYDGQDVRNTIIAILGMGTLPQATKSLLGEGLSKSEKKDIEKELGETNAKLFTIYDKQNKSFPSVSDNKLTLFEQAVKEASVGMAIRDSLNHRTHAVIIAKVNNEYTEAQALEVLAEWQNDAVIKMAGKPTSAQVAIIQKAIADKKAGVKKTKPAKTQAKDTLKAPPIQTVNPLQKLSNVMRELIHKVFAAVAPTFMADSVMETFYMGSFKARLTDQELSDRMPVASTAFEYGVKRMLLKLSRDAGVQQDSSKLVVNGREGVFLTAVAASSIANPTEFVQKTLKKDPKAVIMMVTNVYGEPIYFNNKTFEPVKTTVGGVPAQEGARAAYYAMRNVDDILDSNGNPIGKAFNAVARALAEMNDHNTRLNQGSDLTAEQKKTSLKRAKAKVLAEAKSIKDTVDHLQNNPTESVQYKMNGGSLGYIEISGLKKTPLSKVKERLSMLTATQDEENAETGIKKGTTYATVHDLYGQQIEIERPGLEESGNTELVINLLIEDIVLDTGENLLFDMRKKALDNYIDTDASGAKSITINSVENDPYAYELRIGGSNALDLTTAAGKQEARTLLEELFKAKRTSYGVSSNDISQVGGKTASDMASAKAGEFVKTKEGFKQVVNTQKMHVNRKALNGTISVPSLEQNANGTLQLTNKDMLYQDFMAANKFSISTPDVAYDGKLRRTNAYFTFQLTEQGEATIDAKTAAAEIKKDAEETVEYDERLDALKVETETEEDDVNEDDFFPGLNKLLNQKNRNQSITRAQLKEAEAWFGKHPLSKHIGFKEMFHVVNKSNSSAVATFQDSGITLFKGSDYSDVYHEAWHAFAEMFMSKEEQATLYNEVANKAGSFKDYNGDYVAYSSATPLQIEEYLAEEFRQFMLNGGKDKANSPKETTFFNKILNILKALFGNTTVRDITLDAKADAVIGELFNKLSIGNISEYSYSTANASFGTLNQGITAKDSTLAEKELNYENSKNIVSTLDSFINEYIDTYNSQLTQKERKRLGEIKTRLGENPMDLDSTDSAGNVVQGKSSLEAEMSALLDKRTHTYTGKITKDPVLLLGAYRYSKFRMNKLYKSLIKQAEVEEHAPAKARLTRLAQVVKFSHDNFGTLELGAENKVDVKVDETSEEKEERLKLEAMLILSANAPQNGEVVTDVIGYHMMKTQVFGETISAELGEMDGDTQMLKAMRAFDRAGNESSLKELASAEIVYLLKTLPDRQANGSISKNVFGVNQSVEFTHVWNRLARTLQNTQNFDEMYQRLKDSDYPPIQDLLDKMGIPEVSNSVEEHGVWTNFWQTFNKTRIPLVQMTVTQSFDANENPVFASTIGEAFNADYTVGKTWQANFTAAIPETVPYISTDKEGNYLNTKDLFKQFTVDSIKQVEGPKGMIAFYKAIGMPISNVKEVREAFANDFTKYSPVWMFNKIKALDKLGTPIREFVQYTDVSANKFKQLQILESQNSDLFSNFMVTNAEGNTQFEHSLNNQLTITVNGINNFNDKEDASAYSQLISTPHLRHLNIDENPFAESSLWLRSMFNLEEVYRGTAEWGTQRRKKDGTPVKLKLTNLSGVKMKIQKKKKNGKGYIEEAGEGVSSSSADPYTKLIMDLHLSYAGVPELMRHADKGTSFSIVVDGPILGQTKADENYVPVSHFANNETYKFTTRERLMPHILAEMKRISIMKQLAKSDTLENFDFDYIEAGQRFAAFDDVLTEATQNELMRLIDTTDRSNLASILNEASVKSMVGADIDTYFDEEYTKVADRFSDAEFISSNIKVDMLKNHGVPASMAKEAFIKSYVHNNYIHNIESVSLIYGDLAQYNHLKEGFHKRNAGAGSTGTIYRSDKIMQGHINNDLYATSYAAKNAERLGIKEQHMFTGQMHTAILEDMSVTSAYMEEYKKAGVDVGDYANQNEADAQGLITFDAYRQLKVADGSWSNAQDKLYKQIVNGEPVNPNKVAKFFPVVKGQYWGPLANRTGLPITAFHKYSLFPMIPSVIKDKKMAAVHDRMVKENISYVTFESGSKVGTITKNAKRTAYTDKNGVAKEFLSREYDKVYEDQSTGALLDGITDLSNEDNVFTKNTIHLEYLKNQLEIHDERKGSVIFSTQLRKLIEDGLVENGVPIDYMQGEDASKRKITWDKITSESKRLASSPYYTLYRNYESNIDKLTEFKKQELLDEINWTQGMLEGTEKKDMRSLLDMVQKELTRQDLGQHSIDFAQVGADGNIKWDFSLSLNVEQIEKLLSAMMVKRLVKQKVNGEGLIQVASSLMEEMGAQRKFRNPTKQELKDLGSNDLPSYRPGASTSTVDRYNAALLAKNKDKVYIFGDNSLSRGKGGQAIIRDSKNAFGIPTKKAPSTGEDAYFKDSELESNKQEIDEAIAKIVNDGREVVFPKDGIGTGLAKLKEKAPKTFAYLNSRLKAEFQFDNTTGVVTKSTSAMKVKVALAGDFLKLLGARHTDGKKIKTIERLNKMLKDEVWLNQGGNRAMITMVGVRIPVQGLNSMEFMEVYEFLGPEAGSVIVPPTEIVTKSGADFDVDKMTVMMPNIAMVNGEAEMHNTKVKASDTKENLQELRTELREERDAIRAKYDALFESRDFELNEQEQEQLLEIKLNIQKNRDIITNTKADKKVLYKSFKGKALKGAVATQQSRLDDLYEIQGALYAQKQELITESNKASAKSIAADQTKAMTSVNKKLTQIERELNSYGQKGLENDIIGNIKDILSLPSNFISLVTPNSTSILDPLAKDLKKSASAYDAMDNTQHEGAREVPTLNKKGEVVYKKSISPTRTLEIEYNLYKHESNNVGKQTLGLGAVDNTYNTLFNRIGAMMNSHTVDPVLYKKLLAEETALPKGKKIHPDKQALMDKFTKQTLLMNHNTLKQGDHDAISLSHLKDANGKNSISDVVNQLINGWVDVAADAWIFNIQGNKEISPALLFLIQSGVPIAEAVYFVSNPLIKQYVKEQRLAQSTFGVALRTAPQNKSWFRSHARDKVITKQENGFGRTRVDKSTIKELTAGALENISNFSVDLLKERAKDTYIQAEDRAIFLHFLQIEEMTKAVRDIKMRTNVDTSRDVSLFEAQDRMGMLAALKEDGRIPSDIVNKIQKESPIGSFFIQDFQIKLLGDLFPLRNHKTLNKFIKDNVDYKAQEATYGDRERSVISWKSDLVNFIFQNELRYFDIDGMDYFQGVKVVGNGDVSELDYLKHGAYMKDGIMHVDKATLKKEFKNKTYNTESYQKRFSYPELMQKRTFKTEQEYMHFVVKRESIRFMTPLVSLNNSQKFENTKIKTKALLKRGTTETTAAFETRLVKSSYEVFIRDQALTKTFNYHQLFKSNDTFAHEFDRIRNTYPELKKAFSLLEALSFRSSGGSSNLIVNESSMDGDQLNILHENLDHLSNPAKIREILPDANANDIKEIVDFFDSFPTVAFLQSGMSSSSSYALTPFVPQSKMLAIIDKPVKLFTEMLKNPNLTEEYLTEFHTAWKVENALTNRAGRVRGKYYNAAVSLVNKSSLKKLSSNVAKGKVPEKRFVSTAFPENATETDSVFEFPDSKTYSPVNGQASAKEKLIKHPDKLFVYDYAIDNQSGTTAEINGSFIHAASTEKTGPVLNNTFGIPTVRGYGAGNNTVAQPNVVRDVDGKVDPDVRKGIDNKIKELLELQKDEDITIAFPYTGLGQNMMNKDNDGARFAPQTFVYLSKQLYENFGYVNPQYLTTMSGVSRIQLGQAVSDAAIIEANDQAVIEFIKKCNS